VQDVIVSYVVQLRLCRATSRYVLKLSVRPFVHSVVQTTISRERLEQSRWNLHEPLLMTWLDSGHQRSYSLEWCRLRNEESIVHLVSHSFEWYVWCRLRNEESIVHLVSHSFEWCVWCRLRNEESIVHLVSHSFEWCVWCRLRNEEIIVHLVSHSFEWCVWCRLRNEESIVHLVSTWPFPVLNLNDIEIPVGDYLARETPRSQCVADLVIKGLFYRKVKFCRLQMLVLPKDTREGAFNVKHVYMLYVRHRHWQGHCSASRDLVTLWQ